LSKKGIKNATVPENICPKKRFGAEQIVTLLCQIEVSMAQGK
jgi:hypothetical protein